MKFKQLIVAATILLTALSVQAAFVAGMTPARIRAKIAAEPAPALVLPPPTINPTTQTVCSVSCS